MEFNINNLPSNSFAYHHTVTTTVTEDEAVKCKGLSVGDCSFTPMVLLGTIESDKVRSKKDIESIIDRASNVAYREVESFYTTTDDDGEEVCYMEEPENQTDVSRKWLSEFRAELSRYGMCVKFEIKVTLEEYEKLEEDKKATYGVTSWY